MDLDDSTKRKYKLYEFIEELNEESRIAYLEELELKSDGDRDYQEQILINRLKGNTANDFAPSDTACDEETHRARRDEKLLNMTTKLNLDTSDHDETSASDEHEKTANPTVLDEENIRTLIAKMQRELQETKDRTKLELCQLTKSNELLAQKNKELLSQLASSTRLDPMHDYGADKNVRSGKSGKTSASRRVGATESIADISKSLNWKHSVAHGRTEPVNHYVYCLLTIIGKLAEPWTLQRKLDLLHNNMLPSLQKQVPRYKARSINEFVELARDAENLHSAEKLYQPPIPSNLSMMPETAWDEPEAREKPSSAKLASLSEPIDDIAKMIEKLLDQKLQGLTTAITAAASAAGNRTNNKKRTMSPKNKANADRAKSTREPASDKNKDREAGPQAQVACWGCSWPGYIRPRCPDCSGNAKKEE
ncbi:unnamed protein product [Trichogramma brassicae]|uniref:Uncharacterized protein n=1 Tax=Trichogramma brassicae TaxID=86971 RepID=A0A6H5IW06_9HYME|nr:unnamed protein product [Trichogramma brassicae]